MKFSESQELTVKHKATTCGTNEVIDPKLFELTKFFLKFDEDLVVFELKVQDHKWKEFSDVTKSVWYEGIHASSLKKFSLNLPKIADVLSSDLHYKKIVVRASIKNSLLNLFSLQKKEFQLVIGYRYENRDYRTILNALVPDIDQK